MGRSLTAKIAFASAIVTIAALTGVVGLLTKSSGAARMSEYAQSYRPTTMPLAAAARVNADALAPKRVRMIVKTDEEHAKKGPEGVWHDAFLPARIRAKPDQRVIVTVYNYDEAPHSFTSPTIGLDVTITPGSPKAPHRTVFTFVTPSKAGHYEWFCIYPCDPWAMGHEDYMHGFVTVQA